jgi:hypothetical protein
MLKSSLLCCLTACALCACSTIAEKTNFLSDDDAKAKVAGPLGYPTGALTLLTRKTEGVNTYVTVRASDNKTFVCTINGGNALSMGLVNPPDCRPRP